MPPFDELKLWIDLFGAWLGDLWPGACGLTAVLLVLALTSSR